MQVPPALRAIAFLALCAGIIWAASTEHVWLHAVLAIVFVGLMVVGLVRSAELRRTLGRRLPHLAFFARAGFSLRPRHAGIAAAVIAGLLAAAEVIEQTAYPKGTLGPHVERLTPRLAELPPIRAAAELERKFPAEDQRYTPYGVFLRYEHDVVALLPRTAGTAVERLPAAEAYVKYGEVVGRFWGPAYQEGPGARASAMPVPDERDLQRAARALAAAENAHDACYGWDVEIVSGERKGHLWGSGAGVGTRIDVDCERYAVLGGWIDPLAGRYNRDDPGDWAFAVDANLDGEFPQESFDAISVPFVEMIEGATTEPSDDGAIAGKGLLELIGALPLLAQEADALATPPPPRPRRPEGALAEAEWSDRERRGEQTTAGEIVGRVRAAAIIAAFVLIVGLLAGAVARLIRARRAPASRAAP